MLPLPDKQENHGVSVVEGSVTVAGDTFKAVRMTVFRPGDCISLTAGPLGVRLLALGGAAPRDPGECLGNPCALWGRLGGAGG